MVLHLLIILTARGSAGAVVKINPYFTVSIIILITARKRSLREGYVFTGVCDSVNRGGACVVVFGGHAWFYLGGHAWFYSGGVRGFIWGGAWFYQGHAWFYSGGMRGFIQGGHAWFFQFFRIQ